MPILRFNSGHPFVACSCCGCRVWESLCGYEINALHQMKDEFYCKKCDSVSYKQHGIEFVNLVNKAAGRKQINEGVPISE